MDSGLAPRPGMTAIGFEFWNCRTSRLALSSPPSQAHIPAMADDSDKPAGTRDQRKQGLARDPAKHSKKDPAKPTRAKASRPELAPIEPALEKLLNPGIGQGTAGPGSQTGLNPPTDNSFDRQPG